MMLSPVFPRPLSIPSALSSSTAITMMPISKNTMHFDESTLAIALEMVGTSQAIFDITLEYAKQRQQFGVPIGSFQAIKHRLANMYLSLERATALCYFAALTIAEDDPRRAEAAALAKAAAGDCQRLLALDGLQLHGGIGYTWEHDLHFWLKRAKIGEYLLGTATTQRARLAQLLGLTPTATDTTTDPEVAA